MDWGGANRYWSSAYRADRGGRFRREIETWLLAPLQQRTAMWAAGHHVPLNPPDPIHLPRSGAIWPPDHRPGVAALRFQEQQRADAAPAVVPAD